MSRILAGFLGKPELEVKNLINKLEKKAGYTSEDVRLLADNAQKVRQKIQELGLDADDTTGEELYHSLVAKFEADGKIMDKALGVAGDATISDKVAKAEALLEHGEMNTEVWAIKSRKLKSILDTVTPAKTMKLLRYRSLSSMLKHENILELVAGARQVESATWNKNYAAKITRLSSADYEMRPVKVINIDNSKWQLASSESSTIDKELGVITVNPGAINKNSSVLAISLLIHDRLIQLTGKQPAKKFSQISPVLSWWEEAEYLMAWNDGEPVSLNYKDIAHAHVHSLAYEARAKAKSSEAFWNELVSRYKNKIEALPEGLIEAELEVEDKLRSAAPSMALAEEMQEADF